MGYIIAQHVSPNHRSMMVELLGRETELPVLVVSDGIDLEANKIYITPPNKHAYIKNGRLRLAETHDEIGPKPSIDFLFANLAEDQGEQAIGIILSGTGSDGAHGMRAIKSLGGITIAQEPKSAKYDSMPQASIKSGMVDLVLKPEHIAEKLQSIIESPNTVVVEEKVVAPLSTLQEIIHRIQLHTKLDFHGYKEATIGRQIDRRLAALQIKSLDEYLDYVGEHPEELDALAERFLISVTSFFRDEEAFRALDAMIGEILSSKKHGDEIRIWVAGCATGEEAYSIAILLAERLGPDLERYNIKIFGTDIAHTALDAARRAVYPAASVTDMGQQLLERYLIPAGRDYQVHKRIRDLVVFARHDLVQDPPFLRMDLISCRNVMIYFKIELQDRIFKTFHYSLHASGSLFLGMSEAVSQHENLFDPIDHKLRLFRRRNVPSPNLIPFSSVIDSSISRSRSSFEEESCKPEDALKKQLLDAYAPPSVLVDARQSCLHFFGKMTGYVQIVDMQANLNLLSMIRPEFRTEIRAMSHKAAKDKKSAAGRLQKITVDNDERYVRVVVHPMPDCALGDGLQLVSFEEQETMPSYEMEVTEGTDLTDLRVIELEHDLSATKEHLQTVIEELETSNEELQSINEELQASSEELQSSNEELETTNEELQSTNEELTTVNEELQIKTAELSEVNSDLENIQQSVKTPMVLVDSELRIQRYSPDAVRIFGISHGDLGSPLTTLPAYLEIDNLKQQIEQVLESGKGLSDQLHGKDHVYLQKISPYISASGRSNGAVLTYTDITALTWAEEQLRQSAAVFENTSEAVLIADQQGRIVAVNRAFTDTTSFEEGDALGRNPSLLKSDRHDDAFYKTMWKSLADTGHWQGEIWNRRKNGEIFPAWETISAVRDKDGSITHYVAIFSDISHIKNSQAKLAHLAHHDPLTGLPNRLLASDRIHHAIQRAQRKKSQIALFFVDLDHFKDINDSFGHPVGDELLMRVALLLRGNVRVEDTVARLGGDEFTILMEDVEDIDGVAMLANKILEVFSTPLAIFEHQLHISPSIGISMYPRDGHDSDELIKNADTAMYRAKEKGRNNFQFYESALGAEVLERVTLESDLRRALEQDELLLHYQPQISLESGKLVGVEALIRWQHKQKGMMAPDRFIPLAEESGLIVPIGSWVLNCACTQFMAWKSSGLDLEYVAVNISGIQIERGDLVEVVRNTCEVTGIRPEWIELEITENAVMRKPELFISILEGIRAMGVRLAIDDFGTGQSSLSWLKELDVDTLKIDRSFIMDIPRDNDDVAIASAILALGKSLQLDIVGEGVETAEQEQFLRQNGCHLGQGYLYSRPVPAEDIGELYLGSL